MPKLLILAGVVLVGMMATPLWAQEAERSADVSSDPAAETLAEELEEELVEAQDWLTRVDQQFGRTIVAPLANVLFYDFGTQDRLGVSIPFVVLWLLVGAVFFTLRMGFINIRAFYHAIKLTAGAYDDPNEPGEVSHFQALASALSATVGLGNIAGVAIAVGLGGPGAIFWLIVAGLLGMSSKFAECSLGQMYRRVARDGTVSGGPMHYLRDGLAEMGWKPLGIVLGTLFAVMCMGGSFGGGCAFQVSQSLGQLQTQIPILRSQPWIYGLVMAFLVGIVIIGGIRRIAKTASRVVPIMCGLYVAMAIYVLIENFPQIGPAFRDILGAFSADAAYGGFVGVMVVGIQRAAFPTRRALARPRLPIRPPRPTNPSARNRCPARTVYRYGDRLHDDRSGDCDYQRACRASACRVSGRQSRGRADGRGG